MTESIGKLREVRNLKIQRNSWGLHVNACLDICLSKGHDEVNKMDMPIIDNGRSKNKAHGLPRDYWGISIPVVYKLYRPMVSGTEVIFPLDYFPNGVTLPLR